MPLRNMKVREKTYKVIVTVGEKMAKVLVKLREKSGNCVFRFLWQPCFRPFLEFTYSLIPNNGKSEPTSQLS